MHITGHQINSKEYLSRLLCNVVHLHGNETLQTPKTSLAIKGIDYEDYPKAGSIMTFFQINFAIQFRDSSLLCLDFVFWRIHTKLYFQSFPLCDTRQARRNDDLYRKIYTKKKTCLSQ